MSTIAIITARGGSKRIPKKNIKDFCGKPIMAYSIEAALETGIFDEVMVSTDDREIALIAEKYGAKVPFFRSEKTSDDFATTNDVLIEVIEEYKKLGREFDEIVCIYPTAPFVNAKRITEAVTLLRENDVDEILPVVRFSFPPQRALVIRDGFLEYRYPEHEYTRSQDLEPEYHDCGQFYVFKTQYVLNMQRAGKKMPYVMPETEVQDIDNEEDWKLAEQKFIFLQK